LAAAVVFAFGGFLGAQAEHINQLNAMAWLPWAFLLLDAAAGNRLRAAPILGLGLVIGLMLLAGHAQATYISLAGLAAYAVAGGKANRPSPVSSLRSLAVVRTYLASRLPYVLALTGGAFIALPLTAAQLLPTLELSRLSVRSGGLPYREAVSFSLRPWKLHFTLLPPFGVDLAGVFGETYTEYVAYVGIAALGLAALGLLRGWRARGETRFFGLLAGAGLFLGLGGFNPFYFLLYYVVPGFALFRVPARWMLLYAFAAAVLAGLGMDEIRNLKIGKSGSKLGSSSALLLPVALLVLMGAELFLASRGLRYNAPTAPEAFSFLRPSIAHLKTDPDLGRFLSLSGIVYDPGDLTEMRATFAGQLPEEAIYAYLVAAKEKEVLYYNLPLLYGLYSVDGYDGGLLPLRDFVTMQRLFVEEERLSLDGRLRENLRDAPPGRLLSLLGVKYVITDKVYDVWIDDVFYDLLFTARLSPDGVPAVGRDDLPAFPTTALGVISHLEGGSELPEGTPVARVTVSDEAGWSKTFELLAGRDTSEGRYGAGVAHGQARAGHAWRDDPSGADYVSVLSLDAPRRLSRISVEGIPPAGEFVLRGLSLVDTRTGTSRQVTLSTQGRFRLVHSGDVKIYEYLDVLPRAFVVYGAEVIPDEERAVNRLRDPSFNPAEAVVLAGGEPLAGTGGQPAEVIDYGPEEVIVQVAAGAPGYLVLTDTFYPGWQVTVDGGPAEILRADLMFRAVRLEPGSHQVVFRYRPAGVRWGACISAAGMLAWLAALAWSLAGGKQKSLVSRTQV
jgi:hypothetical protein